MEYNKKDLCVILTETTKEGDGVSAYYIGYFPNETGPEGERRQFAPPLPADVIDTCTMLFLFVDALEEKQALEFSTFGYEQHLPGKRTVWSTKSYKLRYIVGGEGTFNSNPISRGSFCMSAPDQQYAIESSPDNPLAYYWMEITGSRAPVLIERILHTCQPLNMELHNIDAIEAVLRDFIFSSGADRDLSIYAHSVLYHIFALQAQSVDTHPLSRPMMLFREAVEYIEAHSSERIQVSDLCVRLHIVPDYLYKIFRRYSGMSTQDYIINTKIQIARSLLLNASQSLSEVAEQIGYSDYGLFSRQFRRICGCTPGEFRRTEKKRQREPDRPNPERQT